MLIPECNREGFTQATEKIAPVLEILPDKDFKNLISQLLKDREGNTSTETRKQALEILYGWAKKFASFGADIDISQGFSPWLLPPINPNILIETGCIIDPETINQIQERSLAREARGKEPPENKLIVKALTPKEIEVLPKKIKESLALPIISLEESYTVTDPEYSKLIDNKSLENDKVIQFVLGRAANNELQIFFLSESQIPHIHTLILGRWYRIDNETHSEFNLPQKNSLIFSETIKDTPLATNDQIATLLVHFKTAIEPGKNPF